LTDALAITLTLLATASSYPKIQLVVNGVLADPDEGPDSPLYEAFGYIRESERKSGLTRKANKPVTEK
jgi:hypothetical protein